MNLSQNVGSTDKVARLVVGALLIVLAITGVIGIWGWLGLILVGTAFMSFCPIYRVFGLKTCQDC